MKTVRYVGIGIVIILLLLQAGCNRSCNVPPDGDTLNDIWGSSSDDIFAVGMNGTILHYDGNSWNKMYSGTHEELHAVWGSGPNDVFTAQAGDSYGSDDQRTGSVILHYNGTSWNRVESGTTDRFMGLWGTGPDDIYAVGYAIGWKNIPWESSPRGTRSVMTKAASIRHYDGTEWSKVYSADEGLLYDIWGSSPSDIFAVGAARYYREFRRMGTEGSLILHYDGNSWSEMDSGIDYPLGDIWGSGPDDVYAVGGRGTIIHYDGDTWSEVDSGTTDGIKCIWGWTPDDIFAYPIRYNGEAWYGM